MKIKNLFSFILVAVLFLACNDMKDVDNPTQLPDTGNDSGRLFVLCEGLFHHNNSMLACIDYDSQTLYHDFFKQIGSNKRDLGDTANDMQLHNSELWIVMTISSVIEVMDITTGKSLAQISLHSEEDSDMTGRQPRYISFYNNKAYVCCFDGTLCCINTKTYQVENIVQCGRNPDGIGIANGKIYISNSGGMDFTSSSSLSYDKTVSVVDINTFQEIKQIEVGINPYKIVVDSEEDVYVISRGNRQTIAGKVYRINSQQDEVVEIFDIDPVNMYISDDVIYMYNYSERTDKYWIKTFDCLTEQVIDEQFIDESSSLRTPYGIFVHPITGNIFISDSKTYTESGDVYCFEKDGNLRYKIENVGLNPNSFVYLP